MLRAFPTRRQRSRNSLELSPGVVPPFVTHWHAVIFPEPGDCIGHQGAALNNSTLLQRTRLWYRLVKFSRLRTNLRDYIEPPHPHGPLRTAVCHSSTQMSTLLDPSKAVLCRSSPQMRSRKLSARILWVFVRGVSDSESSVGVAVGAHSHDRS